jgi:O-antigen ligase
MTTNTIGQIPPSTIVFPEAKKQPMGRAVERILLLYIFFITVPFFDVPGIGISVTMPLMGLLFLELTLKSSHISVAPYKKWFIWCYIFAAAVCLSLAVNGFIGDSADTVAQNDLFNLFSYLYWLVSFYVLIVMVTAYPALLEKVVAVMALGIIVMGVVSIYNSSTPNGTFYQNEFGVQFTTYAVFAMYMAFLGPSKTRRLSVVGLGILVVAIGYNGSRTSFLTVTVALALSFGLILMGHKNRSQILRRVVFAALVFGLVIPFIPPSWVDRFTTRVETLDSLDTDKSYLIRLLMIQKAERLFIQSPVFGVGIGRFRYTAVELDLGQQLSYGTQQHFNKKSSHNSYLSLLAETGLVGAVPFGFMLLALAVGGLKAVLSGMKRGEFFYIPIYVSFIVLSIHLWALSGLTNSSTWATYALVAGIIARENKIRLEAQNTPQISSDSVSA